jgi:spore germination cell wall hydrolase CwlJ-like protein
MFTDAFGESLEDSEIKCLADNIFFEGRNQNIEGRLGIALVTLNRVDSEDFPNSVCEVVSQRSNRFCQFSWKCDNTLLKNPERYRRPADRNAYTGIKLLAEVVYKTRDRIDDITDGSLYYHADYIAPRGFWQNLIMIVKLDDHIFYKENS